jgi:hypothetical protein
MGKMKLLMTPVPLLLRHTLRQLEATGGGLGDLGEDGIERSHQERLKDNRRMTGLRDFRRRTDPKPRCSLFEAWMLSRVCSRKFMKTQASITKIKGAGERKRRERERERG